MDVILEYRAKMIECSEEQSRSKMIRTENLNLPERVN